MGQHGDGLFERKPGMWYLNRRWEKERYQILLGTHISRASSSAVCVRSRWPAQIGSIHPLVRGFVGPLDGWYSDAASESERCQPQISLVLSVPKWCIVLHG